MFFKQEIDYRISVTKWPWTERLDHIQTLVRLKYLTGLNIMHYGKTHAKIFISILFLLSSLHRHRRKPIVDL